MRDEGGGNLVSVSNTARHITTRTPNSTPRNLKGKKNQKVSDWLDVTRTREWLVAQEAGVREQRTTDV